MGTIVLIIFILSVFLFFYMFIFIVRRIREFSKVAFGNASLIQGIKEQQVKLANEPRSVAGMDKIYLPQIVKDFPNLNIDEMKKLAENSILLCLQSIENKQLSPMGMTSEKISNFIKSRIADLKKSETVNYDSIKFHRTVINQYIKNAGMCSIIFQSSVEYLYRKNNNEYKKIQDCFRTEFIYIIDDSKVSKTQSGIALNCPNCGAPIKNLGVKVCSYCQTGVIDLVKHTWILNDISQI